MISKIKTQEDFLRTFDVLKDRFANIQPEQEVTVRDPEHDVQGYVVVWNTGICKGGHFDKNGIGAGKGGTRIIPDLTLEDVKRLARAMAEKNAAAGLPLGGAKSGLVANHNEPDYEKKCRRFYKLVQEAGILVEDGGKFGGFGYDVGCKPPLNALWACEELGTLNSFTGKPVEKGGTDYDREGIAGLGVAHAARVLLEYRNKTVAGTRFSVQGMGAMGAAVAHYFSEYGGKLTYLSDPRYGGTWFIEGGASPTLIQAFFTQNDDAAVNLLKTEGTHVSENYHDSLYADVDIVFPCAMEDTFTKDNAHKVKAPFICEGANNPTSIEAHEIFFKAGTIVIPDIIANAGGIIAAYVELTCDIMPEDNAVTREKVDLAKIETTMRIEGNVRELLGIIEELNVRPDMAGDYIAYRNIFYGVPKK